MPCPSTLTMLHRLQRRRLAGSWIVQGGRLAQCRGLQGSKQAQAWQGGSGLEGRLAQVWRLLGSWEILLQHLPGTAADSNTPPPPPPRPPLHQKVPPGMLIPFPAEMLAVSGLSLLELAH